MTDLILAIRNLLRNRRRSLSTLLALAVGLSAILLFAGFKANIRYTLQTAYVRTGGHVQIQHRDFYLYGSGNPTAYGIAGYAELAEALRTDATLKPLVAVISPRLQISGVAGNFDAGVSTTVIGTGFVPEDVNRMRLWNEYSVLNVNPHFVLEGAPPDTAIVGIGVARVLQLCERLNVPNCPRPEKAPAQAPVVPPTPGPVARGAKSTGLPADVAALASLENPSTDAKSTGKAARVELLSSSGRGAPNVAALNVIAAEDQGFKELDEVSIILHLDFAQRLVFGRSAPRVTAVMVQLRSTSKIGDALERVRAILKERKLDDVLVARDFKELNPFYVQSAELFDAIFGFIFVLIGGIVLFTVGNTMNAAVVERTSEIGTLRAIGLRRAGIQRLFVIEGFLLGCCGAVSGMVAALVIAQAVNHSGLTWLPPGSSERLPLQLRIVGEYFMVAGTAIGLVLIATLSAWLPAWRAARMRIVEALRHV